MESFVSLNLTNNNIYKNTQIKAIIKEKKHYFLSNKLTFTCLCKLYILLLSVIIQIVIR